MIRPVRGASSFALLRSKGRRLSRSSLWCTWCPDPHLTEPAVAFAITRRFGNAVQRNLFRRRIRSILNELDRRRSLPAGLYLIGPTSRTKEHKFDSLRRAMESVIEEIDRELNA